MTASSETPLAGRRALVTGGATGIGRATAARLASDGAAVVEWPFKGIGYLVKQVLKEAGDAAVIEPADVREAVLAAAERLVAEPAGR